MDCALLSLYALTAFTLIATPGPVVALVVNTSSTAGPRRGLMTAFGSNGASLALILVGTLILSGTIAVEAAAINWMGVVGCCYITLMSWRRWRSAATSAGPTPARATATGQHRHGGSFLTGFVTGIANPSDVLFFVSFFPRFTSVSDTFAGSIAILTATWIVLDVAILAAYVFFTQLQTAQRYQQPIARLSSGLLLLVGASGIVLTTSQLLSGVH